MHFNYFLFLNILTTRNDIYINHKSAIKVGIQRLGHLFFYQVICLPLTALLIKHCLPCDGCDKF